MKYPKLTTTMTPKQQEEASRLFAQFKRLPASIARRLAGRCGIPLSVLVERAEDEFVDLVCREWWHRYDPTKSSECTWLHQMIYFRLLTFIRNATRRGQTNMVSLDAARPPITNGSWISRFLAGLGNEAAEVVQLMLWAPAEFSADVSQMLPQTADYLQERCGWSPEETASAIAEVRHAIASV